MVKMTRYMSSKFYPSFIPVDGKIGAKKMPKINRKAEIILTICNYL